MGGERGRDKMNILPVFTSDGSLGSSILTLEEAGKTKPNNPVSIIDLAKSANLKQVILIEDRIDNFLTAYKNLVKIESQLIYGIKFVVCMDCQVKGDESLRNESKVIIFIKNAQGYHDLLKFWNRAWTKEFYYQGRLDWKILKELWTPNLLLAMPFFSSFIAKNSLTFASILPDFPIPVQEITFFKEMDSGLPFARILDRKLDEFCSQYNIVPQPTKSIYYEKKESFKAFQVFKAIHERSSFEKPNLDHFYSNKFCFQEWQRLAT
jgi:DNA polymerase III alpha subunit